MAMNPNVPDIRENFNGEGQNHEAQERRQEAQELGKSLGTEHLDRTEVIEFVLSNTPDNIVICLPDIIDTLVPLKKVEDSNNIETPSNFFNRDLLFLAHPLYEQLNVLIADKNCDLDKIIAIYHALGEWKRTRLATAFDTQINEYSLALSMFSSGDKNGFSKLWFTEAMNTAIGTGTPEIAEKYFDMPEIKDWCALQWRNHRFENGQIVYDSKEQTWAEFIEHYKREGGKSPVYDLHNENGFAEFLATRPDKMLYIRLAGKSADDWFFYCIDRDTENGRINSNKATDNYSVNLIAARLFSSSDVLDVAKMRTVIEAVRGRIN